MLVRILAGKHAKSAFRIINMSDQITIFTPHALYLRTLVSVDAEAAPFVKPPAKKGWKRAKIGI